MVMLLALLGLAWGLTAWCGGTQGIQCPEDHYPLLSAQGSKCCNRCKTEVEKDTPCPGVEDPDCKCTTVGYRCVSPECSSCVLVPTCGKGTELTSSGSIQYSYRCQDCSSGKYSNTENGFCKNWTDCRSKDLKTIESGNRTHDAVCGIVKVIRTAPEGDCTTEHEHINPLEDSWSCQLPEEEHGERILVDASVKQSWQARRKPSWSSDPNP
ncbi:tumor necrosis factor receptor superfamily member 18 isoform X2 [Pleurodeles waltl]|uniref:tumor necrosis factor receptor superfamily member 18 isoform X2 n=1 Tax=Pleurodeles waltl TaxID=8319 RepID=UPI0037093930